MQEHLGPELTIPEVARAVCYSAAHVRKAFREVTGRGALPYLLDLRLRSARELLQGTSMGIAAISTATGFRDPAYFARIFRQKVGQTPSAFRQARPNPMSPGGKVAPSPKFKTGKIVFQDRMDGPMLQDCWKPILGNWQQEKGYLCVESTGEMRLDLGIKIPENFELSLEFLGERFPRFKHPHITIGLRPDDYSAWSYLLEVGQYSGRRSRFTRQGMDRRRLAHGHYQHAKWQRVCIGFSRDSVFLRIPSGREFVFREPFEGTYNRRCRVSLESWNCRIRIRNVVIRDAGPTLQAGPLREGDVLYTEGLFMRAAEFYQRMLPAACTREEIAAIHYKWGQSLYRLGSYKEAREHFTRSYRGSRKSDWAQFANTGMLRIFAEQLDSRGLATKLRRMSTRELQEPAAKEFLRFAHSNFLHRGFVAESRRTLQLLCEVQKGLLTHWETVNMGMALCESGDHALAAKEMEALIKRPGIDADMRTAIFSILGIALLGTGKWKAAERAFRQAGRSATIMFHKARIAYHRAICLRMRRKLQESLAAFKAIADRSPVVPMFAAPARCEAARVMCMLGHFRKAYRMLAEARKQNPRTFPMDEHCWSEQMMVPLLLLGEFAQAAELMESDLPPDSRPDRRAYHRVVQAIVTELSGDNNLAAQRFRRIVEEFPQTECNFAGKFAANLAAGKADDVESFPAVGYDYVLIVFLVGLLQELRGKQKRAMGLYELAGKADVQYSWVAHAARMKLKGKGKKINH